MVYIARSTLHLVPGARPGGLLLLADGQRLLAAVLHAAVAVSCLQEVCIWAAGRQALPARLWQRPSWCYRRLLLLKLLEVTKVIHLTMSWCTFVATSRRPMWPCCW